MFSRLGSWRFKKVHFTNAYTYNNHLYGLYWPFYSKRSTMAIFVPIFFYFEPYIGVKSNHYNDPVIELTIWWGVVGFFSRTPRPNSLSSVYLLLLGLQRKSVLGCSRERVLWQQQALLKIERTTTAVVVYRVAAKRSVWIKLLQKCFTRVLQQNLK